MAYNQTQRAALELLRARLDTSHPMYAGSAEVTAALSGPARLYVGTWILPVLDYLTDGEQWHGQGDELKREHASRASAAQARKQWEKHDAERSARAAAGLHAMADACAMFDVSDLGAFSLADMLEANYHDEAFCAWAKTCAVGASYQGGGEPCTRIA